MRNTKQQIFNVKETINSVLIAIAVWSTGCPLKEYRCDTHFRPLLEGISLIHLKQAGNLGLDKEALTHGNKSTLSETKVLYQRRPVFVSFPVTKPVVTKGTSRHQMKDIDIIFPLIPLSFLKDDALAFQSRAFFQELTIFAER